MTPGKQLVRFQKNMQTITITLSKEYFVECFQQSIRYANKWRKVERVMGVLFIVSSALLFMFSNSLESLTSVLLVIGIYELINPILKKIIWLRRQMKSKIAGSKVHITISETGMNSESKFGNGSVAWDGIEKIIETPKGLLIWPQKGIHTYLQKKELDRETIKFILSKQ